MDHNFSSNVKKCLREVFKFELFKSREQLNAIITVLTAESDVLINLPPTAGKSLCFQLPAVLYKDKVTIVFMNDKNELEEHVQFLETKGIKVCYFNSKLPKSKQIDWFNKLSTCEKTPNFIYFTVATCVSHLYKALVHKLISNLYENKLISMFVVDDAHYASDKTIDYNKSYSEIITIRNNFPNVRLIALTSVGTEIIKNDIKTSLRMLNTVENNRNYKWSRPNIYIDVKFKDLLEDPFEDLTELIKSFKELMENFSGIVLCRKYQETVMVADELSRRGISAVPYYSRMTNKDHMESKEKWMTGKVVMIVTTHSSTSSLNKSNVGCLIHWTLPLTIEQYYRDIGKAGRLGEKALCRIYFGLEDWMDTQLTMMGTSTHLFSEFEHIINFCIADKCRHVLYSESFRFNAKPCEMACDVCDGRSGYKEAFEKFKIHEQQHRLLAQSSHLPVPKIYLYDADRTQSEMILNPRLQPQLQKRKYHSEKLVVALIKNHETATNKSYDCVRDQKLQRLARSLEYIAFSTNNFEGYCAKMTFLVEKIKNDTKSNILSNYILNYKFTDKEM